MAKMSKSAIVGFMAEKCEMPRKAVMEFMDVMAELALKEVKKSGEFVVLGLGKLVKVHRKERMGRNPATGAAIKIPAKTVVKFRIAKATKEAVL